MDPLRNHLVMIFHSSELTDFSHSTEAENLLGFADAGLLAARAAATATAAT